MREAQLAVLHAGMLPQPLHGALGWASLIAVHRGSPSLGGGVTSKSYALLRLQTKPRSENFSREGPSLR